MSDSLNDIRVSVRSFVRSFVRSCVCLLAWMSVSVFACLCVCVLFARLCHCCVFGWFVCVSVCLPDWLHVCACECLCSCLFVCLFACLSV